MKSRAATHPDEVQLRKFALTFPESHEDFPWGESAFKIRGKIFLFMYVHAEGIKLSVKLPQSNEHALAQPFAEPTGYGLGKSGWVTSQFGRRERVPMELFARWIEESFRAVAPKKIAALLDGPAPAAHKPTAPKRSARKKVAPKPPARARKKR
ncbi:MAG: MmcQ/YjbR family DNA-binding protein [Planctomycetes bacterium]|nr:MmcQ/YjbR family DNA-binding protein [Planctomycetota bacterium]